MKMIRFPNSLNFNKLNKRQEGILSLLEGGEKFPIAEILAHTNAVFGTMTKITLNRDLKTLIEFGFIIAEGKGKSTVYKLSGHYSLIRPFDVEKYFRTETDKRQAKERFNFEIFSILKDIFTKNERGQLDILNKEHFANVKKLPESIIKKEFERLTIELSWKSSQIEGNTYSLLETEHLIKGKEESGGHSKQEAIMILNHKETLDYIRKNKKLFENISVAKIEQIHYLLTKNLGISKNLRKRAVGIVGAKYKPLDNEFQIKEALEKTCKLINKEKNLFAKALLLSIMIAYIQPFEDGNKRTSRLAANAVLMTYNICPLSYRSVDEVEYKKAVILFYEQNNISYFKQLFMEQFEFAVKNYFK